jgi:hypothetical protein
MTPRRNQSKNLNLFVFDNQTMRLLATLSFWLNKINDERNNDEIRIRIGKVDQEMLQWKDLFIHGRPFA